MCSGPATKRREASNCRESSARSSSNPCKYGHGFAGDGGSGKSASQSRGIYSGHRSKDYGLTPTWETSCGSLNGLIEDNPYFGIAHPNYQKFSKLQRDPVETLRSLINSALKSGQLTELQEAYRLACCRDGQGFLVESRLIAKVIRTIHETVLKDLKEAAEQGDTEACEAIQDRIANDSILAPLVKSKDFAKVFVVVDINNACKMLDFKARGKKEPPIPKQEKYLDALKKALRRGDALGLSEKDLMGPREVLRKASKKLNVLTGLQKAMRSNDDKELLRAIEEAEEIGLRSGEMTKMKAACLGRVLEEVVAQGSNDEIREMLTKLDDTSPANLVDPQLVKEGWKKVCKSDIIRSVQAGSGEQVRKSIHESRARGVDDELDGIISQARSRLDDIDRREDPMKMTLEKFEIAVYGRDIAKVEAWLDEAQRSGATASLVSRARAVLCEDSIQKAIAERDSSWLEQLIREGQRLMVDSAVLDQAMRVFEQSSPADAVVLRISDALSRQDGNEIVQLLADARRLGVDESKLAAAKKYVQEAAAPMAPRNSQEDLGEDLDDDSDDDDDDYSLEDGTVEDEEDLTF